MRRLRLLPLLPGSLYAGRDARWAIALLVACCAGAFAGPVPAEPVDPDLIPSAAVRGWYLSPEEVGRKAELVVRGTVESVESREIERSVWTDYTVRVGEVVRGGWEKPTLVVRQAGGRTADLATCCGPALRAHPGEAWVLALASRPDGTWCVYGLTQGAFRVRDGSAVRDYRSYLFKTVPPEVVGGFESIELGALMRCLAGAAGEAEPAGGDAGQGGGIAPEPGRGGTPPGPRTAPGLTPTDRREPGPKRDDTPGAGLVPVDPASGGRGPGPAFARSGWIAASALAFTLVAVLAAWRLRRRRAVRWAAAVVALLLAGASGWAYLRSQWTPVGGGGISWNVIGQTPSGYFVNGRLEYHLITTGAYAIPTTSLQWAVVNAFQTWEDSPEATITFVRGTDVTDSTEFSIGFSDTSGLTQWGSSIGGASGVSTYNWSGSYLINTDICFNRTLSWTTDGSNSYDLESTALHEIGHSIGFAHDPHIMAPMSYEGAWDGLTSNSIHDRRLTENDDLGLALVYPPSGWTAARGTISGTVKEGTNALHQAQVGVFDSQGRLVMTTLANLGDYKVERLLPGTYALRAFPAFTAWGLNQPTGTLPWNGTAPSPFLTSATNDGSAPVTANGSATCNLTAAAGTPAMFCEYSIRTDGGGDLPVGREGAPPETRGDGADRRRRDRPAGVHRRDRGVHRHGRGRHVDESHSERQLGGRSW